MKVTFIMPAIGRKKGMPYSRSWQMEPLGLAVLAARTPPEIERVFFDDRLEAIPFDESTDLVAMSVETYTANRAYQIAGKFRARNIPVVMGGYHPSLLPDEVAAHADAVVVGEGEQVWPELLQDMVQGRLKKKYVATSQSNLRGIFPDRSLFKGKNYFDLTLIETGRGCRFGCEFCSINAFYHRAYAARPVEDVVAEITATGARKIFFVDDNIANDPLRARELFSALIPLHIRWISQVSMHIYKDNMLLDLMRQSGCRGVLIGFETMQPQNLQSMGKEVNTVVGGYDAVVRAFHHHHLAIYGTFVFGYNDSRQSFAQAYSFAMRNSLFYTAFNHLVPFPGTQLYSRLKAQGLLRYPAWWTDPECRFGNIYFNPQTMTPQELEHLCYQYRFRFFGLPALLRRLFSSLLYWRSGFTVLIFLAVNLFANRETRSRRMLPFGVSDD
jgi:radical SAM superfamily enzyme YgiQ (UPF0313 family)